MAQHFLSGTSDPWSVAMGIVPPSQKVQSTPQQHSYVPQEVRPQEVVTHEVVRQEVKTNSFSAPVVNLQYLQGMGISCPSYEQDHNQVHGQVQGQVPMDEDDDVASEENQCVLPDADPHNFVIDMTREDNQYEMYRHKNLPSLDERIKTLDCIPEQVMEKLFVEFDTEKTKMKSPHVSCLPPEWKPVPEMPLGIKHAHPRDARIQYVDEPHLYFIDGSCQDVISATTLIGAFFPKFDREAQANQTFNSKTFAQRCNQPSYDWYGCKCPEDIMAKYDQAGIFGTEVHDCIEKYINYKTIPDYKTIPENNKTFQQFLTWYHDKQYRFWEDYRTEWRIFDEETLVAGSIDYVGYDPKNKCLYLFDWKRTKGISFQSFGRMRGKPELGYGVINKYDNCNGIKYSLQLNLYKYILEKNYGVTIKCMYLVHMNEKFKQKHPAIIPVPNMQEEIISIMACRKVALGVGRRKRRETYQNAA